MLCCPAVESKNAQSEQQRWPTLYVTIHDSWISLWVAFPKPHRGCITPHPDSRSMTQIARNLTDPNEGFLGGKRYLILDRDTKYSDAFRSVLVREGIQVVRLPARSPNLNAFAEQFVRSIKEECLSRMIFFAPASLQHALRQFMAHYPTERNHQGLENRIPQPMSVAALPHHPVQPRQRLGGMLSYYHRVAA